MAVALSVSIALAGCGDTPTSSTYAPLASQRTVTHVVVAGDTLYGAPAQVPGRPSLGRYFLHAHRIRFFRPADGEPVSVASPLPRELEDWMAAGVSAP